ncbi:MAG TPA: hypothetical protein VEH82_04130, partial [Acidimicrobiales bacterium]|nr:hypothetical protein [Acidimicrobiales bacterium]
MTAGAGGGTGYDVLVADVADEHVGPTAPAPPPAPPPGPAPLTSLAARVLAPVRAMQRFLHRRALARATYALPRTARVLYSMLAHGEMADDLPAPSATLGFAAQVAMDEALLAMAMTPSRFPLPSDY